MADASRHSSLRGDVLRALFGLLYRSRTLYWLASAIPFAGQWRRWQRLALDRLTGHDILEVGCGTGTLLADMALAGYACSAIDASPQMVSAARAELRRRAPDAGVVVRQGSVTALPYPSASFDSVVSTFPTEYIYDPDALREIARVLRPGGRLVIVLGATLLPVSALLLPFVAVQTLAYGARPRTTGTCVASKALGASLPFAAAGLTASEECVRGPFWEAYVVCADKR